MNSPCMQLRVCWKLNWILVATLVVWAGAARAAEGDPFAETPPAEVPSNSNVPPAPASAPAEPAASIAPGVVEQLPASAYPEPVTRGLYGGPLWLDMQGLQWPYMPKTGVGISGYGWIDGNYRLIRSGNPAISPEFKELLDQGRFLLRVTPTYTSGAWFVQAQAEIVANTNQYDVQPAPSIVGADDVWVRTGEWSSWDVTVGRMQGFDVYPLGMGLDLNTYERLGAFDPSFTGSPNSSGRVPALYNAEYLFYRPGGTSASRVSDVALHLYPLAPLRIEILGQFGDDGVNNVVGGRPAAIYDLGFLKLRGALEYQYRFAEDPAPSATNTIKSRGGAGSAQVVFAPYVEAGINFGYAVIDATGPQGQDPGQSGNRLSYGGFVDLVPLAGALPNLMLGGGLNYATFHNLIQDAEKNYERSTNLQWFVAAQYLFYKQLYVKVVGGYAKSHFENKVTTSPYDDDMFSFRVRVQYLF
jgi:hypothetical protein